MAEKEKKPETPAPDEKAAETKPKKGLPVKTIGVVAALMIAEAAAVYVVFGMFGGPKTSEAHAGHAELKHDEDNEVQEIELVEDKFQNLTTGRVWIWDVSLFVQVRKKNVERVERVLEQRGAEIKEGIGQIVSKAQHSHLKEPERQSLNRQFSVFLEKVVGTEEDGKALVERVLIPKCRGYPSDF